MTCLEQDIPPPRDRYMTLADPRSHDDDDDDDGTGRTGDLKEVETSCTSLCMLG